MSTKTQLSGDARVRTLETEVRALRQRLEQREQMLAVLNRRLLQLERGENGSSGMDRAETGLLLSQNHELLEANGELHEQNGLLRQRLHVLDEENAGLHEQLKLMRDTKLFRWSSPARDVYARLRRPR